MPNLHGLKAFLAQGAIRDVLAKTDGRGSGGCPGSPDRLGWTHSVCGIQNKAISKVREIELGVLALKIFFGISQFAAKPDPCNC